jgi:hypothetical protein
MVDEDCGVLAVDLVLGRAGQGDVAFDLPRALALELREFAPANSEIPATTFVLEFHVTEFTPHASIVSRSSCSVEDPHGDVGEPRVTAPVAR